MPGFTEIDDNTVLTDTERARAEVIAERITEIGHEKEQERWRRQSAIENPGEHWEPDFETDEEQAAYEERKRFAFEKRELELDWLHEQLGSLNCRMMRPYEHWNEEERYMEYMERDRY